MTQKSSKPKPTYTSAKARSRIGNGHALLVGLDGRPLDGRSLTMRRYRELLGDIATDAGGADRLSAVKLALCRRFAEGCVLSEIIASRIIGGAPVDITEFAQLASTLVRLASRIGLGRHAKQIPVLADYLQAKDAERVEIIEPASIGSTSETR
jgi:hypothetical protein